MNAKLAHPTSEDLVAFGLGKLDDADATAVAHHLEACEACSRAVKNVPPDSFVALVRADKNAVTRPPHNPASAPKAASSPPSPPAELLPGLPPELAKHQRYRILRELGRGGMGVVYQAEDLKMERLVAIKVLNKSLLDRADAVERFHREGKSMANLAHQNIVHAYDTEQVGDLHLLVMEYVEGDNLAQVLERRGSLPVLPACHYIHQAAKGLQYAFEQGMVHRDIKPQNLILTRKGEIKILDFGLARLTNPRAKGPGLTQDSAFLGTPEYIAPEQAQDAREADIRADIYSLGCTLYCLLAGRPPFQEDTDIKLALAHIEKAAPPLHELCPAVPKELSEIVSQMMAKDPVQRYQTPVEVMRALLLFCKPEQKVELPTPSPAQSGVASPGRGTKIGTDTSRVPSLRKETASEVPAKEAVPARRQRPRPVTAPEPEIGDNRGRLPAWAMAVGIVFLGLALIAGVVILLRTPEGTLVLEIDPPGTAEVIIDGEEARVRFSGDGEPYIIRPAGEHDLEIRKGGFKAFTRKITLTRGDKQTIHVRLEPLPGTLVLEIDQPGADVVVDEKKVAVTLPADPKPIEIQVPPGQHKVEVRKGGFKSYRRDVTISAGKRETVKVPLELVEEPKRANLNLDDKGWVPLFNGKDQTGWRVEGPGKWEVGADGTLVGHGPRAVLVTNRDDFKEVTLRTELSVSADAEVYVLLRLQRDPNDAWRGWSSRVFGDNNTVRAGHANRDLLREQFGMGLHEFKPNESFALTIQAIRDQIWVRINGIETAGVRLGDRPPGRIGLFVMKGTLRINKIEVKELPPTKSEATPVDGAAAENKAILQFFNGRDFTGWEGAEGYWRVENGAIIGAFPPGKPSHTNLCSKERYGDFELRLKIRLTDGTGTSGVVFRSEVFDKKLFRLRGPKAEFTEGGWGNLWGIQSGGMMKEAPKDIVSRVLKKDDFNDFFIRCVGKHITIQINSATMVEGDFPTIPDEGIIGLHIGLKPPKEVIFKEIVFKDLSRPSRQLPPTKPEAVPGRGAGADDKDFVPLFNRTDTMGWNHHNPKTIEWTNENGVVTGRSLSKQRGTVGSLATIRTDYSDFHLRCDAMLGEGNNCQLRLRCNNVRQIGSVTDYLLQIACDEKGSATFNLHKEYYRNQVKKCPEASDITLNLKRGQWFKLEVVALGKRLQVKINDQKTVDYNDPEGTLVRGWIELVCRPGCLVRFRDMEIKEILPKQAGARR